MDRGTNEKVYVNMVSSLWSECWGSWGQLPTRRACRTLSFTAMIIAESGYKASSARGKEPETKARGDEVPACRSPLPVQSGRTCLSPPAMDCGKRCRVLSTREAPETQCPGIVFGAAHIGALSAWHLPQFQTPRGKASIQLKWYCVCRQFRHSKPFLTGNGKKPPKSWVPKCQPRAVLICRPF